MHGYSLLNSLFLSLLILSCPYKYSFWSSVIFKFVIADDNKSEEIAECDPKFTKFGVI